MIKKRVVITGIGLVTPLGVGVKETWTALCDGKSGIGRITRFDATLYQTQIAGEIKEFKPTDFISQKDANRATPFIAYSMAASRMAMEDSGLIIDAANAPRVGVFTGCGLGGLSFLEETTRVIEQKGQNG